VNIGKRVVQLWSHANGNYYQIHLPAPQTLEHAKRHVEQLPPSLRDVTVIVELEVVEVVPAEDVVEKHDTIPAPRMTETEAAE
jgi:hypothetical protein